MITMPLEKQVASLELCKRLKELGASQETLFRWVMWNSPEPCVWGPDPPFIPTHENVSLETVDGIWSKGIAAYTVAELGILLPVGCVSDKREAGWAVDQDNDVLRHIRDPITMCRENEADSRAELLIALIERGVLEAK